MPELAIGARHRSHCLGLIDRAEQRLAHPHIIERRMQMVEAQDAHGRCKVRNHRDVAVARKGLGLIVQRHLPPVDFYVAQGGCRRKLIQYQPLDSIKMSDFWP